MKRLMILVILVGYIVVKSEGEYEGECKLSKPLKPRPHSVSVLEFGAVGDGKTLNTVAFQNAIFYLKSFADKGGGQLYVPPGKWLTGSINLTSHLTFFLEKDAVILGSQDYNHWDVIEPLPSYGRGTELPGARYRSLITGSNLYDVVITGNNGSIDGQGSVWWELFNSGSLNYSRPHLVEFMGCNEVAVSNLTFLNAPSWNIHAAYCNNVLVQNITLYSPPESPYTSGVVPDSSEHVCIEHSNMSTSYDVIALKSGWDEYGISYGKPTTNVHIRGVNVESSNGAGIAFGSEMSGGISDIIVEDFQVSHSNIGVEFKTARGRGGYIKEILVTNVIMENVHNAIKVTGQTDSHPDDKYDRYAFPFVTHLTFNDIIGTNIIKAGIFSGISESPFTGICLSNISFSIASISTSSSSWICSNVSGSSTNVFPEPCSELQITFSGSSSCFSPSLSLQNSEIATI